MEHTKNREKYHTTLKVNGIRVTFEVDSGAAVTIMNYEQAIRLFTKVAMHETDIQLSTYSKQKVKIEGYITVTVHYRGVCYALNIYLTKLTKEPLLGREWLRKFLGKRPLSTFFREANTNTVHSLATVRQNKLQEILSKYQNTLTPGLSRITGLQARLSFKPDTKPIFLKSRSVPFKLLLLIERELNELVENGVFEKVNSSEWATPIVPVLKKNNRVRICGDYSVTINPQLVVDEHPLPTVDELFSTLAGGG